MKDKTPTTYELIDAWDDSPHTIPISVSTDADAVQVKWPDLGNEVTGDANFRYTPSVVFEQLKGIHRLAWVFFSDPDGPDGRPAAILDFDCRRIWDANEWNPEHEVEQP